MPLARENNTEPREFDASRITAFNSTIHPTRGALNSVEFLRRFASRCKTAKYRKPQYPRKPGKEENREANEEKKGRIEAFLSRISYLRSVAYSRIF